MRKALLGLLLVAGCEKPPPGSDSCSEPGCDPTDDCFDSFDEALACHEDMDIVQLEGSCTSDAATLRVLVAGGPPVSEPATSQQRQAELAEAGGDRYVVMTASANGGPYTCTALMVDSNGPVGLALGEGDSCGVSADGDAFEFVLTSATAGFVVATGKGVTFGDDELADSSTPIDLGCPG